MGKSEYFIVFTLENQPFALELDRVERIARVVGITPLPDAPNSVIGIINVQGNILPVVDLRKRFKFPSKEINPDQHLIISKTDKRTVALLVDTVQDILEGDQESIVSNTDILPNIDAIGGIAKIQDSIILIHDLDKCLSLEDEKKLDKALK